MLFGGNSESVTPVPIPHTEVKPVRADGTAREAWGESRSPPIHFCSKTLPLKRKGFFLPKSRVWSWGGLINWYYAVRRRYGVFFCYGSCLSGREGH